MCPQLVFECKASTGSLVRTMIGWNVTRNWWLCWHRINFIFSRPWQMSAGKCIFVSATQLCVHHEYIQMIWAMLFWVHLFVIWVETCPLFFCVNVEHSSRSFCAKNYLFCLRSIQYIFYSFFSVVVWFFYTSSVIIVGVGRIYVR